MSSSVAAKSVVPPNPQVYVRQKRKWPLGLCDCRSYVDTKVHLVDADVLYHFHTILFPYSGKIPLLARFLLLWYDMVRLLNKFLKNVSFPNRIFPSVRMCILENYAQKSTWKPLVFAMGWG